MSKKSASQVKLAKKPDLPPIEDVFKEAKEMFVLTVETQCRTAERVDNLLNIREYASNFWKVADPDQVVDFEYIKQLHQLSLETYRKILERTKTFDIEDFKGDTVKDYYDGIVPSVDAVLNDDDLCRAGLVYLSVSPYGQKLVKLHQLIQDEIARRESLK